MTRTFGLFVLGLFLLSIFVEYDLADRSTARFRPKKISRKIQQSDQSKQANTVASAPPSTDVANRKMNFEEKFHQFTIDTTLYGAEQIEEKTKELSQTVSTDDVEFLAKVLRDPKRSGDERALALEILSRNQSKESLKELERFVRHDETRHEQDDTREFESVLRAQAIEGIASFPQKDLAAESLKALVSSVKEVFLKDRLQRSIAGLQSQSSTEVQPSNAETAPSSDSNSLKNLIE